MPQLDKFTYFTPLFWFCLFLFICNLLLRFYLPLDFEVKVFCYYLTRPKLQRALSIMKWFICIYCLVSCGYRIYSNFFSLIFHMLTSGEIPVGNGMLPVGTPGASNPGESSSTFPVEAEGEGAEAARGEEAEPSALEQRAQELLQENLEERKGALAKGQEIPQVRKAVEEDFHVHTPAQHFDLVQQLEVEKGKEIAKCPATKSTFNEIKDFQGKVQDGFGGKNPRDSS
jgi:hypothetical protein